ncbi:unnamed protein product, partial [Amoebophrya sp. A25]
NVAVIGGGGGGMPLPIASSSISAATGFSTDSHEGGASGSGGGLFPTPNSALSNTRASIV